MDISFIHRNIKFNTTFAKANALSGIKSKYVFRDDIIHVTSRTALGLQTKLLEINIHT